jgi:superfamily II DNA or RNA helicase
MVLTEGFDLPAIDGIVLARATKSKVLFAQALGRGLRLSPETGKVNCLLLDATGATERHNLFSVAELLGLSEATLSEEQSILEAVAAQEEEEDDAAATTLLTETVQATAVDLVRRAALSWVETPRGAYALSMAGSTFRLRSEDPARSRWLVELKRKDTRQYQRLEAGLPLAYAFGVAEDTARSMGLAKATAKEAQWRQRPPSPGQLQFARQLGIVVDPRWRQGAVSDAITQVTADWYWPR